jgi:hypothetical protein
VIKFDEVFSGYHLTQLIAREDFIESKIMTETWIVRKNHETSIQTAETKFLRPVGETGTVIQIANIIQGSGKKKLNVFNLNTKTQNYSSNWLQHLHRREQVN